MSLAKKVLIFVLSWVPLSFLFQNNPHLPIPLFSIFAPVMGFFTIFHAGAWRGNEFSELTLPWLVFWLVILGIIIHHCRNKKFSEVKDELKAFLKVLAFVAVLAGVFVLFSYLNDS